MLRFFLFRGSRWTLISFTILAVLGSRKVDLPTQWSESLFFFLQCIFFLSLGTRCPNQPNPPPAPYLLQRKQPPPHPLPLPPPPPPPNPPPILLLPPPHATPSLHIYPPHATPTIPHSLTPTSPPLNTPPLPLPPFLPFSCFFP